MKKWKLTPGFFNIKSPGSRDGRPPDVSYDNNHMLVPFDYLAELDPRVMFLSCNVFLLAGHTCVLYDKVRQSVTSKSKSKTHGPITGSDRPGTVLIRACDWSMLFAFAFAHNTLTHFVILGQTTSCDVI